MTIEKTTASPYRTNVRPQEIRASSWRNVVIASCVVVGLLGVSGAAAIASTPKWTCCGVRDSTKNSLKALHAVAESWRANNHNECPTVQRLKEEKELAASSEVDDAWGDPYEIRCTEDTTFVTSSGPDRKRGTDDDVIFPLEVNPR